MAKKAVKWIPTQEHIQTVVELASHGVNVENIAITLGITFQTWYTKLKEFPELAEAYRLGRAKAEKLLASELWDIATNPSHRRQLDAIKFHLERKHKWSEKVVVTGHVTSEPLDVTDEQLDKLVEDLDQPSIH